MAMIIRRLPFRRLVKAVFSKQSMWYVFPGQLWYVGLASIQLLRQVKFSYMLKFNSGTNFVSVVFILEHVTKQI